MPFAKELYSHADVPRTPDNGTQVADGNAVADSVDVGALLADRGGNEADAVDDGVALAAEGLVRGLDGAVAVADLGDGGVQVNGNLMVLHGVTQEGGVGKAGGLCRDQVVAVLDDDGVLAGEDEVIRRLAGGLAAAEEDDLVALDLLLTQKLTEGAGLLKALDLGHGSGNGAGADDDLVKTALDGAQIVDLGIETDLNAGLGDLALVPLNKLLVVLLEGHGGGREEQAAELVFLLEDDGVVAALLQNQRALHAADAAADDGNLLRVLGRDDLVAVVLHGGRVERPWRS